MCPKKAKLFSAEEGDEDSEVFPIRHAADIEQNTYKLARPVVTDYVRTTLITRSHSLHTVNALGSSRD